MILEKAFWEMIFGIEDALRVYGFLKTYIMMVTNMKNYVTLDPDDDDAYFRYIYRETMISHFKQGLYNKNFILQDQSNCDENDTFQRAIEF